MTKKIPLFFFIGCLFLSVLLYYPTGLYFLNDDLIHIPLSSRGILFQHNSIRPVHEALLWLDASWWGKNPYGYHLLALIIHLAAVFVLFQLIRRLLTRYGVADARRARDAAFLSSGLFAVYAFHSEAVLWIIGAGAALGTLFYLLSILCYLSRGRSVYAYIGSLLFLLAGLFTYESVFIAPLTVCCIYVFDTKLLKKQAVRELPWLLVYIGVFCLYLFIRIEMTGSMLGIYEQGNAASPTLSGIFLNYNRLLARTLLPPLRSTTVFIILYIGILILLTTYTVVILFRMPHKLLVAGLLFILLTAYLPYIFLGIDTHTRESERYLYLPSATLFLFCGYIFATRTRPARAFIVLGLITVYNLFFLYLNRRDYVEASRLSRECYQKVGTRLAAGDSVRMKHLPAQFNGVPVFRKGFPEGLAWLYSADTGRLQIRDTVLLTTTDGYQSDVFRFNFPPFLRAGQSTNGYVVYSLQADPHYFRIVR